MKYPGKPCAWTGNIKPKRAKEDELLALLEAVSALGPIGLITLARSDYAITLLLYAR